MLQVFRMGPYDAIEARYEAVRMRWLRHFGEILFYC